MADRIKFSDNEIQGALAKLPGWTLKDGQLHKEFQFSDFVHAFGFMATSALKIEVMNHHPEWRNVYRTVVVDLSTHDAGGITAKDVELALVLDEIAGKLQ